MYGYALQRKKPRKNEKKPKKIPAYFKIDCIILKPICFSSSPVHYRKNMANCDFDIHNYILSWDKNGINNQISIYS